PYINSPLSCPIFPFISYEQTLILNLSIRSDSIMKGAKSKGDTKKADSKLTVKKVAPKGKAAKDPNKPKRPASAFFVFMEDFRKQFKEENPGNKSVAAEKAPFVAKAEKRKKEYEKTLASYNKKLAAGGDDDDDEDSDKSKSEVNDEEDEEGSEEDEDDD
ncbi:hypothetical protein Ccrd_014336, partial [Cynara cardunculus var. scolymus]